MCINTDSSKAMKKSRFPRRQSKASRRPSKINETMASMMIDTYEADRVNMIAENQQQQQRPRPQMRKSVSFDEVVMVRPVLALENYTDQEIISCWYLPIEKQRTKIEIMNIIKVVRKKNETSEKQFNIRGLEHFAAKDKTYEKKRKASIRDVLKEQKAQREAYIKQQQKQRDDDQQQGSIVYDMKQLRKVYRRYSRSSSQLARAMGQIDEIEAGIVPKTSFMKEGHDSFGSLGSCSTQSTQTSHSTNSEISSSRFNRSISAKGASSKRTRSGSKRFSLGSSRSANQDMIIGGTVSIP